jgi:aromatic ring-opening dioxygenase catalytic subunit (LigB family)
MIGSGMSYHNMAHFMGSMRGQKTPIAETSRAFDEWLAESMSLEASKRETRLVEWEKAPFARDCHPREEHLIPLMVMAGAAGDAPATLPYRDVVMNAHVSAVHFG